jgi:hypothetical protein
MTKSKERRRASWNQCLEARAKRSDEQQLKLLDGRPGNQGKERTRLTARIAAKKAK